MFLSVAWFGYKYSNSPCEGCGKRIFGCEISTALKSFFLHWWIVRHMQIAFSFCFWTGSAQQMEISKDTSLGKGKKTIKALVSNSRTLWRCLTLCNDGHMRGTQNNTPVCEAILHLRVAVSSHKHICTPIPSRDWIIFPPPPPPPPFLCGWMSLCWLYSLEGPSQCYSHLGCMRVQAWLMFPCGTGINCRF